MGSLAPSVTGLYPLLRATDGQTFRPGRCDRVALTVTGRRRRQGGAHVVAAQPRRFHEDAQATNAVNQLLTNNSKGDKVFEVEMQVQDDDLDSYGVVNNAIYPSYIQHVRDMLLNGAGMGDEYWTATGHAMATAELNLKYFAPLRSGDRFVVKVWPEKMKGVRIVVRHLIETVPDGKLVLDARATIVFLDKDYRPTRVFPELAEKAREAFPCMEC